MTTFSATTGRQPDQSVPATSAANSLATSQKLAAWILGREITLLHFYLAQSQFSANTTANSPLRLAFDVLNSSLRAVRFAIAKENLPDSLATLINNLVLPWIYPQTSNPRACDYQEGMVQRNNEINYLIKHSSTDSIEEAFNESVAQYVGPVHQLMGTIISMIENKLVHRNA